MGRNLSIFVYFCIVSILMYLHKDALHLRQKMSVFCSKRRQKRNSVIGYCEKTEQKVSLDGNEKLLPPSRIPIQECRCIQMYIDVFISRFNVFRCKIMCKLLFIYWLFIQMYLSVFKCVRVYSTVVECIQMYKNVFRCIRVYSDR